MSRVELYQEDVITEWNRYRTPSFPWLCFETAWNANFMRHFKRTCQKTTDI